MSIRFVKADALPWARNAKLLVHARSGGGKTYNAVRAALDLSRVLVGLTETQGMLQVSQSNPTATVVHLKSYDDWLAFMGKLQKTHDDCEGKGCDDCRGTGLAMRTAYDVVVLDGLTDLQRLVKAKVEVDPSRPPGNKKLRAGALARDDWMVVGTYMERAFTALRDLDVDVVATAISDEVVADDGSIKARPALQGAAKTKVGQYFSAICHLQTRIGGKDDVIREGVFLAVGDEILAKPNPALQHREPLSDDNTVGHWLQRIKTYNPAKDAEPDPDPKQEKKAEQKSKGKKKTKGDK